MTKRRAMPVLTLLALVALAFPPRAGAEGLPGRVFLSWHAPYGTPGASDFLNFVPGDTTRVDTLFVCAETDSDSKSVYGYNALFYFHSTGADTLREFWRMGSPAGIDSAGSHLQREDSTGVSPIGKANVDTPYLGLVCNADPQLVVPAPWPRGNSISLFRYDWYRSSGRLRILFVVPANKLFSVQAGRRYCWGRILLRRPPAEVSSARQPVCVELNSMTVIYGPGLQHEIARGERWVAVNSRDACAERRGVPPAARKSRPRRTAR